MRPRVAIFASTQLELFESIALARALHEHSGPVTLLLAGDSAAHERDLVCYRARPWAAELSRVHIRQIGSCRAGSLERILADERPSMILLPGAVENPMGLASVCSVAAGRAGIPALGIWPADASLLLCENLPAALSALRERGAAAPALVAPWDYILADFAAHGLWSGAAARARLGMILNEVEAAHDLPVVWPSSLCLPLDILDWFGLASEARLILTDRADVQIAACALGVPCVTLLERTNAPETVRAGANLLAGSDLDEIQRAIGIMARKVSRWEDPWNAALTTGR